MADEFDDDAEYSTRTGMAPSSVSGSAGAAAARLVARLFSTADNSLRARILSCLLQPLGPLGLAAIASGAFASLLGRVYSGVPMVGIEESARYSGEQVYELTRFVEQVQPEALMQVAALLADNPVGSTALGAAALTLLLRALQNRERTAPKSTGAPPEGPD